MNKTEHIKKLIEENPLITNEEIMAVTGAGKSLVWDVAGSNESRIGISPEDQSRMAKNKPGVTKDFSQTDGTVEFRTNRHIKDIDKALREQNVDMDTWMVDRIITHDNSWDVTMKVGVSKKFEDSEFNLEGTETSTHVETRTNYQFKIVVHLKRRPEKPVIDAVRMLIEEIPKFKFNRAPKFKTESGVAGEMALLDAHLAKLAWAAETGQKDYDLKIGANDYIEACDQNLSWMAPFKPEKIYYILGQDYLHFENYTGTTFRGGNILDHDTRLPKAIKIAIETQVKCIYSCRSLAPVEVIWIPGNHDEHASLWLACLIDHHFKDDKYVTVDLGPSKRKARRWGNLLVGWAHDISRKYPSWNNELAQAYPELWGRDSNGEVSKFREWHCGHKHKKMETKMHPTITQGGVLIRQLTALSPIDAWHFENLFTDAVPGGESLVWSKDNGVIANFTYWTK